MTCSPERLAANRANALKSTGPKTVEGKGRSRANGVKHGLTGAGVALPTEDAAEVERRFAALGDELRPRTEREVILARRAAFLSVRLERCAQYEVASLSESIRTAEADHDDDRLRSVETWAGRLADRPAAAVRELGRTPEGIDWMIRAWDDLLGDLLVTQIWLFAHVTRAENLQGRHADQLGMSHISALSSALHGDFRFAYPDGPAFTERGPDTEARVEVARADIAAIIDEEMGRLRKLRASISTEDLARSRAEAAARRLFDPSDAAQRFRRYESAAAREMYRAFAYFDGRPEPANAVSDGSCDALGSLCRDEVEPDRPAIAAAPAAAPVPVPDVGPPAPVDVSHGFEMPAPRPGEPSGGQGRWSRSKSPARGRTIEPVAPAKDGATLQDRERSPIARPAPVSV